MSSPEGEMIFLKGKAPSPLGKMPFHVGFGAKSCVPAAHRLEPATFFVPKRQFRGCKNSPNEQQADASSIAKLPIVSRSKH